MQKRLLIDRILKPILGILYPHALEISHARGMRQHFREKYSARQTRNKVLIYGETQPTILYGPFKGLTYLNEVVWGSIEPKWLGTYEHELHEIVSDIIYRKYNIIVDVGSAEGYYSVGLAHALSEAKVLSFDIDPWAREQQARLAKLNDVKNLTIRKRCNWKKLENALSSGGLVVCDTEGYEYTLLDPEKVPALLKSDILVELHLSDKFAKTISDGVKLLSDRFRATHIIQVVDNLPEQKSDIIPLLPACDSINFTEVTDENRDLNQAWLWCRTLISSSPRPAP